MFRLEKINILISLRIANKSTQNNTFFIKMFRLYLCERFDIDQR